MATNQNKLSYSWCTNITKSEISIPKISLNKRQNLKMKNENVKLKLIIKIAAMQRNKQYNNKCVFDKLVLA